MATNVPPSAPVAQPPAAPKKTSPLVWIVAGCGGIIVIGTVLFAVAGYWGVHKLKGFAESAKKNPAVFAAKLAVAANPELEIVSSDDAAGTVTIRNKKTGEEITMNAADIKNGRLKFSNEKGEEVTFQGNGEKGKEGLKISSKTGSLTVGGEGEALPVWVPPYPGAKTTASMREKTEDGFKGTLAFSTADPPAKVLERYEAALKGAGLVAEQTGGAGSLKAATADGARTVEVVAMAVGGQTQVTVAYQGKGAGAE